MKKRIISNHIEKLGTVSQGMERYKFSRNTLMRIAENEGAVIRIGRMVRIDIEKLDKALEQNYSM